MNRPVHRVFSITLVASALARYSETPFTILISCILSLRTQDKTTDAASERLYKLARAPKEMAKLSVSAIQKAIYPVGFYRTKAKGIKALCKILNKKYGGKVPDTLKN